MDCIHGIYIAKQVNERVFRGRKRGFDRGNVTSTCEITGSRFLGASDPLRTRVNAESDRGRNIS